MKKGKSNFLVSTILILSAIVFTILVKVVDVQSVGINGTRIGLATINMFVFKSIGVNMEWYHITDWLGLVPIFIAIVYAIIGVIQLVKRKSLFKVDKEIIILGIFYIVVIAIYVLFEKVIINYRPILMNGYLEASYPSSHTLMAICLCGSSIIINKKLFKNRFSKFINIVSAIIILVTIIGRLISGVHWFTDIVGGIIISISLLSTLHSIIEKIIKED
jgi:undecaprenyl-diphosphatase